MTELSISIIIATKNRHEQLRRCLESVVSCGCSYREIIVVDSSTDDAIQKGNEEAVQSSGGRYRYEPGAGLSAARNLGIEKSSGDIVVFADDDFIVDKHWLEKLVQNYDDPEVVCCTGRMLPYREDEMSQLFERSMSPDAGDKKRVFTRKDLSILKLLAAATSVGEKRLYHKTPGPWAVGRGFCSFRRWIFDKVGYFDTNLGGGAPCLGGDETDMFYRVLKTRYKTVYEPEAIIYHDHRQTFEELLKDEHRCGFLTRAFISKYYPRDLYMFLCFWGYFFHILLAVIKAWLGPDTNLKKLLAMELKGFLQSSSYKRLTRPRQH